MKNISSLATSTELVNMLSLEKNFYTQLNLFREKGCLTWTMSSGCKQDTLAIICDGVMPTLATASVAMSQVFHCHAYHIDRYIYKL